MNKQKCTRSRSMWPALLAVALLSGVAQAQTSLADDEAVKEAVKEGLEKLDEIQSVAGAAVKERAMAAPLFKLLLESDHLICEAWIIKGYTVLRDLTVANADPAVIDVAQKLLLKVEKACAEEHRTVAKLSPKGGGADGPAPDGPGAYHPVPGWSIEQEVCARKCHDQYAAYLEAVRFAESIEKSAASSAQTASEAKQRADDLEKQAADAEQAQTAAKNELRKPRTGSLSPADVADLTRLTQIANRDVASLKGAAKKARAEADDAARIQASLEQAAKDARADVNAKLAAYHACVSSCMSSSTVGSSSLKTASAPVLKSMIVGVVVPDDVPPGQTVSGSLVTDPQKYQNIPGLKVIETTVPASGSGSIQGLVVDTGDGKKQPADKPFLVAIPIGAAAATLMISMLENPGQPVATPTVPVNNTVASNVVPKEYSTTPVTQNGVQEIHGPTTGNTTAMKATLDGQPATILASKPGTLYVDTSRAETAGAHQIKLYPSPGAAPVALTTHVVNTTATVTSTSLHKGQSATMTLTVDGLQSLPADAWGNVVVKVINGSPAVIKINGKSEFSLNQKDFAKGPFTTTIKLMGVQDGPFNLSWTTTPSLKPTSE